MVKAVIESAINPGLNLRVVVSLSLRVSFLSCSSNHSSLPFLSHPYLVEFLKVYSKRTLSPLKLFLGLTILLFLIQTKHALKAVDISVEDSMLPCEILVSNIEFLELISQVLL